MANSIHDYLIDHRDLDWSPLLAEWAWLLPEEMTVWFMNRFGDLFLVFADGSVNLLDIGSGSLQRLAADRDEFATRIDDGENAADWLFIPLVDQAVAAGLHLGAAQCYSYKTPPVLGGKYTLDNVCVLGIGEHLGAYGSIHKQLQGLPDGTEVRLQTGE